VIKCACRKSVLPLIIRGFAVLCIKYCN
jgi:hypothetical protein